jgi:hypothetical protein
MPFPSATVIRGGNTCSSCYDPAIDNIAAIQGRDAVKLPRVSIAKLMVIVGIVALNAAAVRAFMKLQWNGYFFPGLLIGLTLEAGLLCLIRSRIGFRPFWWGFEAFGLASAIIPVLIALISLDVVNWYIGFALNLVECLFCTLIKNPTTQGRLFEFIQGDTGLIIIEFAIFLPQLFVAVAGGLLASLIVRLWAKARAGCLTKLSSQAEHAASIDPSRTSRPHYLAI